MSLRATFFLLIMACQALWLSQPASALPPKRVSVDSLLDWNAPFKTTPEQVSQFFLPMASAERPAYASKTLPNGVLSQNYDVRRYQEPEYELTFLNSRFTAINFLVSSTEGKVHRYWIGLKSPENAGNAFRQSVDQEISRLMAVLPTEGAPMKFPGGPPTRVMEWSNKGFQVFTRVFMNGYVVIEVKDPSYTPQPVPRVPPPGSAPEPMPPADTGTPLQTPVAVDLDYLLNFSELWACTPEVFEQKYRAKTEEKKEEPPQFEWLNAEKTRARFSRKMFANLETRLTLFGKSTKVEEATLEFVNGRAARVTVSFYNRGDSGNISTADFNNTFKKVGQDLGQIFKVAPTNQSAIASTAVKTVSWQWKSPLGIALLEHNEYAAGGIVGQPEFLRLKLASPDQADWSMGKLAVGVQKMALLKNITKNAGGDVFISGVPMVDQGAKGYCVAASCQRLFEYMQIPCDQHEIAQLVNVDAESGANIFNMQKSLAKIDGQYRVAFKPFINPELYYSGYGKRRVSQRQFSITVKEHVDKGVPLLWALELGRFPEEPPLPNAGQVSGGHMRLVIGYNLAKKEIIFTDSWGAGHELKRMSEDGAYAVTLGLYSMSPRGL